MTDAIRSEHYFYDSDLSTTFVEPEVKIKSYISFGSGGLKGYFVHDKCTLGDLNDKSSQIIFDNFNFGLVTKTDTFNNDFDAIIGMAYPGFAEPGVVPFFDGLMATGKLTKNVFAFHMSQNPENEKSELMLGDWDESKFSGTLKWYDVELQR